MSHSLYNPNHTYENTAITILNEKLPVGFNLLELCILGCKYILCVCEGTVSKYCLLYCLCVVFPLTTLISTSLDKAAVNT